VLVEFAAHDYASIEQQLRIAELQDSTSLVDAVSALKNLIHVHLGDHTPCQVVLVTEGSCSQVYPEGVLPLSPTAQLHIVSLVGIRRVPLLSLSFLIFGPPPFSCDSPPLRRVCVHYFVTLIHPESYPHSVPHIPMFVIYPLSLITPPCIGTVAAMQIDPVGDLGPDLLAEWSKRTAGGYFPIDVASGHGGVEMAMRRLIDRHFKPFDGRLSLGQLSSPVTLYPLPDLSVGESVLREALGGDANEGNGEFCDDELWS